MIKRIVKIENLQSADDTVLLSWFDIRKPNLSAISEKGVEFILKTQPHSLNNGDILISEDGYKIKINIKEDELFVLKFKNILDYAKTAYEIGNRHQPVYIEELSITVLNDSSLGDIIHSLSYNENVSIEKVSGVFRQNAMSHHAH
ncbi:MAG: urease accessory protein UreE [Campylobacteraceae bacterium]|jgi:urease accessory protein|nr:urease accessory protein UreE [Campylobacteraceae bacterium]